MNFAVPRLVVAPWVFAVALGCDAARVELTEVRGSAEAGVEAGVEAGDEVRSAESSVEGGDSSEEGDAIESEPTECRAPTHVSTAAQLEAAVDALEWGGRQLLSNGSNLSVDLVFDADVELATTRLTSPDCGFGPCFPIDLVLGAANGTCLETTTGDAGSPNPACSRFRVPSGASFRILKVTLLGGFFSPTRPTLLALPVCNAVCAAEQRECASLHVCMPATDVPHGGDELAIEMRNAQGSYCGTCLGQSPAQCACFTFGGPKPDGTACSYDTSDDTGEIGMCHAGRCAGD